MKSGDAASIDLAIRRINLGHALIAGFGGVPLIYMGDEVGLTNDPAYLDDPDRAGDGRWMQRPTMDWDRACSAPDTDAPHGRIFRALRHILSVRAACPELGGDVPSRVLKTGHGHLFCAQRPGTDATTWIICNFTEDNQRIHPQALQIPDTARPIDALSDRHPQVEAGDILVPPLGCLWLRIPIG